VIEFSTLCTRNGGKLKLFDRAEFDREFARFGEGVELELTIREGSRARVRSRKANAYLWSVVYALMSVHTGHSPEDIHDAMCERFLPSEQKRVEFFNAMTGERLEVETDARRSSKLTGAPFYDFVELVRQFAREFLDVDTPDPDPEYWRKRASKAA
jgi:hypothetical protein